MNAKGEGDKSAIHCAAIRNQIPTLNVLIEFGADVNIAVCYSLMHQYSVSINTVCIFSYSYCL